MTEHDIGKLCIYNLQNGHKYPGIRFVGRIIFYNDYSKEIT